MKQVTVNLYSFEELNEYGKEKAIQEHKEFLDNELLEFEDENSNTKSEYIYYSDEDVIDNILANEYMFFHNGDMATCVTYCGKHPKAGTTEFKFKGETYAL